MWEMAAGVRTSLSLTVRPWEIAPSRLAAHLHPLSAFKPEVLLRFQVTGAVKEVCVIRPATGNDVADGGICRLAARRRVCSSRQVFVCTPGAWRGESDSHSQSWPQRGRTAFRRARPLLASG
eukprot:gnl/TRDRNA2_/TRDRNA2_139585_c1_seq2.p1 gnl/TRDRNA2_/TRDRNA2_139585_c1~~gnl/TRDRNA2_/TRDRNA2_139585_c1_seq2.p1  ORF type:complete len:122 (-),score=10.27 gnl/TRDRNA2_/TRDRNA2_139585_c1_seq2:15-380(-)